MKRVERLEIWKPIPGKPGFRASTLGRIQNPSGKIRTSPRRRVTIIKWEGRATAYWVLLTFKGPPKLPYGRKKGCHMARHLDDDVSNNRLTNLAWGTQADNIQDALRNGIKFGSAIPGVAAKVSKKTRGRLKGPQSEAHRDKISASLRVRWKSLSKEERIKQLEHLTYEHSPRTCAKISNAVSNYWKSLTPKERARAIAISVRNSQHNQRDARGRYMKNKSRQYPLNKHQADKFSVRLEDLDFKTVEERTTATEGLPKPQHRSRARKALDFGLDYGGNDPPKTW